jgi:hypothetical protein
VGTEQQEQASERTRHIKAKLAAEIPYMLPIVAEMARVAAGQPGDGSLLAQRIDRITAARDHSSMPAFNNAAERSGGLPPAPALVAAWQGMLVAQGLISERLPDPLQFSPRFWDAAAQYLGQETTRREQSEQEQELSCDTKKGPFRRHNRFS